MILEEKKQKTKQIVASSSILSEIRSIYTKRCYVWLCAATV